MKLYFPRTGDRFEGRPAPRVRPTALPRVADELLDRHGARVLRPSEAIRPAGAPAPAPTIYRHAVLLAPEDTLAAHPRAADALDRALAPLGLRLTPPVPVRELVGRDVGPSSPLRGVPRPLGVVAAGGAVPVVPDAWTALQGLRAAAGRGELDAAVVDRIRLEHVLVGANMATHGSGEPGGLFLGTPQAALGGRVPVEALLAKPHRRGLDKLGTGRRPVVAVLDTGISPHPWLDVVDRSTATPGDEFVVVDGRLQQQIRDHQVAAGVPAADALDGVADRPAIPEPLVGELDSHFGHGTFIAGLIRQVAPDATVRAIRVMYPDGVAYESDLLLALASLTDEMHRAQAGDPDARPVDVVCLSLGYFDESDAAGEATAALTAAIDALTATGVAVVASAGNYATSREFYPAALAGRPVEAGHAPTVAVGALNPNGTVAGFSDQAGWVSAYAPGVALLSTFPRVAGSVNPTESVNGAGVRRETFDPDDFTSGFALWSGTSFAGPVVAGVLASALLAGAVAEPGRLSLTDRTASSTVDRAWQAWAAVQKQAL